MLARAGAAAIVAICLVPSSSIARERSTGDLARYVNPFNGTDAGAPDFGTGGGAGNTFPGAVSPFGMVQWSPDTHPSTTNFAGGYSYEDSKLRGFSLTHLSGAGCAVFQDLPFLPTTEPVTEPPGVPRSSDVNSRYVPRFTHAGERAEPGYYRVRLDPGKPEAIDSELTATTRTGFGRFTYPPTKTASMIVNAGGSAMANGDARFEVDPRRREVSGWVESGRFCYQRNSYRVHFAARFTRPFAAHGTWKDDQLSAGSTESSDHSDAPNNYKPAPGGPKSLPGNPSSTAQAGAYVTFDTRRQRRVEVRVGVSFTSVENARRNVGAETSQRTFSPVRAAVRAAWNRALGRARVDGGTVGDRRTYYTALYHSLLHPNVFSDAGGQYMGMDGRVHRARGFVKYANFSGWDVYRSQLPLLAMLFPTRTSAIVRSLLADGQESGWLPKWSVANGQTNVMVGDSAAPTIAGAHALGVRGFDAKAALTALVKGATETGKSSNAGYVQREGLTEYKLLGYVPYERNGDVIAHTFAPEVVWGSASTSLEYVVADFAIAQLAAARCARPTYAEFMRRSGNWRKLLNPDSGYVEPRTASGLFPPGHSPTSEDGFVEGNGAQYTWFVPHDPAGLFAALGGRDAARRRLDHFFAKLNAGPAAPHAFLGNEPTLGTPWLYAWLGRPWRTQEIVRRALLTLYSAAPKGMPGNDDLGEMSSWYVLGALGLYPALPGTDVLVLGSPLFPSASVRLVGGTLAISAPGTTRSRPYVRGLRLNGRAHGNPWLRFGQIARGARLNFDLHSKPSSGWGSRTADAPPSFGLATPLRCTR
jgi:predicted alpha-1,2-mannosidase